MRQAILFDKTLADRYKGLMQLLTSILTLQKQLIADIAIMYMQLPLFMHSVNLVRWYAEYRNDGVYNADTYMTAMTQIKQIVESQHELEMEGKICCPTLDEIRRALEGKASTDSLRKKATETAAAEIDEPLFSKEAEEERERKRAELTMARAVGTLKKLPAILPDVMEHADLKLNEEVIERDLAALKLKTRRLSQLLPPSESYQQAYGNNQILVYDLVIMTVAKAVMEMEMQQNAA